MAETTAKINRNLALKEDNHRNMQEALQQQSFNPEAARSFKPHP